MSPIGRAALHVAQQQKISLVTGSALTIDRQIALHLARDGDRLMTAARHAGAVGPGHAVTAKRGTAGLTRAKSNEPGAENVAGYNVVPGSIELTRGLAARATRVGRACRLRCPAGAAGRRKSRQWCVSSVPTTRASSPDRQFI